MNLKPFEGPGSTPARRRFWDAARSVILATRKVAGTHVTVDEHPGKGTVINVERRAGPLPSGMGACCYDDGTCGDLSPSDCSAGEGHYQGEGTTCAGTDCTNGGCGTSGACCVGADCSILCPADCVSAGGTYQGDGTDCDPNPCLPPPPCPCGPLLNPGDGLYYTIQTDTIDGTTFSGGPVDPASTYCHVRFEGLWDGTPGIGYYCGGVYYHQGALDGSCLPGPAVGDPGCICELDGASVAGDCTTGCCHTEVHPRFDADPYFLSWTTTLS